MFELNFYTDTRGRQPIKEYIVDLAERADKDSRVKFKKIDYYLQVLKTYGTEAGEPYIKHIEGDIWELRPLRDRFFFFCWQGDSFVLLHHFVKKTQKTPPREIERAKRNMKSYIERSAYDEE